jgi:hypothetical protein
MKNLGKNALKLVSGRVGRMKTTLAIALLLLLPALATLAYILFFGVNVVYYDQYEFVPLIDKLNTGDLTFGDLYAQHNEHRIFFPRLVMLGLAEITHYNTVAEMCVSWGLAVLTVALLFLMYRYQFGSSPKALLAFVPVAWLIFSLRQIDNWLCGWQLQIFLCILALVFSLYCLRRSRGLDGWLAFALSGGIVASFSFLNGLLAWPAGLLFLLLVKGKAGARSALVWSLAGALMGIAYFIGWSSASTTSVLDVIFHAPSSIQYLLVNLGAPLGYEKSQALASGIFLSAAILFVLYLAWKTRKLPANALWVTLLFFSVASSGACLFGRSALGIDQALSSRYVTLTSLAVIGLYVMVAGMLLDRSVAGNNKSPLLWTGYGMLLGVIILGLLVGYIGGIYFGASTHADFVSMKSTLQHYGTATDQELSRLYPFPSKVRLDAAILEKYRLNVFS